jgi:hypothetical protein
MTTPEEDDKEFESLRQLFANTAEEASGPTLTKLSARAADIPARAARKMILPRWAWGPVFAGAAIALGGVLVLSGSPRTPAPPRAAELGSAAPVVSVAVASASPREIEAAAPGVSAPDETNDTAELLGDADEGARFDVSGPQSDRDLDAWLAATKELSGGT